VSQTSRLAAITGACVVVFGEAASIRPDATRGLPVKRCAPEDPLDDDVTALVVVDVRSYDLDVLVRALHRPGLDGAPVLVVAAADPPTEVIDALGACDVLVDGHPPEIAALRIASLIELGVARLGLSIAEQALEHSVNGLSIADVAVEGAPLLYVSKAFETMTGFESHEATGHNCRELLRGEREQPGMSNLRAAIRERSRAKAVVQNHKKDGTPFWNEVTIFPITMNGRATRWMGGVQHDVTSLREAQAAVTGLLDRLTEQQLFSQAILDGIDVGIVTTDGEGSVTFANRTAHTLLRPSSDVRGWQVERLLGLDASPAVLLGTESRIARSQTVVVEDGSLLELDLSLTRGESTFDRRVGFFFIFRDAREAREFEAERHRFEHLVTMGTMVAGFAHEVRNPVAALRSITEELEEVHQSAGLKLAHPSQMLKVLARIERLVETSLQYGRPAAPRPARHRPWALLSAALGSISPRIRGQTGDVRIEVEPELRDVFCDDGQVVQALVVLLDNALDATGDPARVLLRAHVDRPEDRGRKSQPPGTQLVRIDVVDDGPGISSEIVPRIFDPFFTTKAQGTGLGLSIAQQLVRENRGRLEVSSRRGGPTTFSIVLPTSP
jgi:PAS domain S-box-containing protein